MQHLLTLLTYCATLIIFMVNQNHGVIIEEEFYRYHDIDPSISIPPSQNFSFTLSDDVACVIQKTIDRIDTTNKMRETHSENVHLWLGYNLPLNLRLKFIEKFAEVVEQMKEKFGSLESIQLFREVKYYKSKELSEVVHPDQRLEIRAKLFKIKITEVDLIIRKIPIDNTKVEEEDALVLFCSQGIFIFLGEKITEKERKAAFIFSNHFESYDSMKYYLENRNKKIINIGDMNRLKTKYASAEQSQSSYNNYSSGSYTPTESSKLAEPTQFTYYDFMSGTSTHAEPSQSSYNNYVSGNYVPAESSKPAEPYQFIYYDFMSDTSTHAEPSQSSDYDFISDRYENVYMYKLELGGKENYWIKSPNLKDLDENVAFILVDYREETMFLHIPKNANSSVIEMLFKIAETEIENWPLKDQTEVLVMQNGLYTAEFLIHFPGEEKTSFM